MLASVSLLVASGAVRVASLNLCTDEYLLMLARPSEIASVSFLSRDPQESSLWREARRFPANRGSLEGVIGQRPTLVLSMGGSGRATRLIAGRLGIRSLTLSSPSNIREVERNMMAVAAALGDRGRAAPLLSEIAALRRTVPAAPSDAIWVSGGGLSLSAGSLGAEWLGLAGYRQRALAGGRADLETLLVRPPAVLIRSEYRSGQMSRGNRWLDHPIVRNSRAKIIATDGRAWTCVGPSMIAEVARLRRSAR